MIRKLIGSVIGGMLLTIGVGTSFYGNIGIGLVFILISIIVFLLSWLTGRSPKHRQIE